MLPRSHFASPDEAKDYLDQLQDNLRRQRQDRTPEERQADSGPPAQPAVCYDFRRLRQLSTVVVSKVRNQMSLEECKSWTCIVLLGLRAKVQVKGLSY